MLLNEQIMFIYFGVLTSNSNDFLEIDELEFFGGGQLK